MDVSAREREYLHANGPTAKEPSAVYPVEVAKLLSESYETASTLLDRAEARKRWLASELADITIVIDFARDLAKMNENLRQALTTSIENAKSSDVPY
jgi:hypothetical protein